MSDMNYFQKLFDVNVSDKIEKKNGLSYVSWSYAWAEVKKLFPDATYTVYENKDGWNYHTDGRTCWVKTGMTINGIEHVEMLPVMDFRNKSIPLNAVTSMDVNKTIQRSLTKAAARHGLGLYVYAGEDLPECENQATETQDALPMTQPKAKPKAQTTTGETVPAPRLSPEMAFLNDELGLMAQEKGATMAEMKAVYMVMVKAMVKEKLIPDKKQSEYTKDEIASILDYMKSRKAS